MTLTGHCLCGACRFELTGAAPWTGHCHCESCRRATASPVTSFIGQAADGWRWIGETPKQYVSSPGVTRWFCPTCGSPLAYASDRWPDEMHFYAALLDHPEAVTIDKVFNDGERLPWKLDGGA